MRVSDINGLIRAMDEISKNMNLTGGGNWSARNLKINIDCVTGIIEPYFTVNSEEDPARQSLITEFETIMTQSKVENVLYDFKQGLFRLSDPPREDTEIIPQCIKTLIAMCNTVSNGVAYICLGVADKKDDSLRINTLFGVNAQQFRNYFVTGLMHEAESLGLSYDRYYQKLIACIREVGKNHEVSDEVIRYITGNIRTINYYDLEVVIIKLKTGKGLETYDGTVFIRQGANNKELSKL